jgi:predicted alpha/beta-hydrolase family hydrolase
MNAGGGVAFTVELYLKESTRCLQQGARQGPRRGRGRSLRHAAGATNALLKTVMLYPREIPGRPDTTRRYHLIHQAGVGLYCQATRRINST